MPNNQKQFDQIYNRLEGWGFSFRRSHFYRFNKYERLISSIDIKRDILEVGCGTGFFSANYLYPKFSNRLISCDISPTAIEKAKFQYSYIDFRISALPNLENFGNKKFQLITATEILYYLSHMDQQASIRTINSLLESKGYLLISVNIGEKPYFSTGQVAALLEPFFEILLTDSIFIKSYFRLIETKIWGILALVSRTSPFLLKPTDSNIRKIGKYLVNKIFCHKLSFYTYGGAIACLCKAMLYIMPIGLINFISKSINHDNEHSIAIFLAKKKL